MAKQKVTKTATKKHLARLERERRQTRAILVGAAAVIAVVLGLIAYSILDQTVIRAYKPVVKVNGEIDRMREFQIQTRLYRQELITQYQQLYNMAQMIGIDPNTDSYMNSMYYNTQQQLNDPQTLGTTIINKMIETMLINQYAEQNNISVTDEEIEQAVRNGFQYYPGGTPTSTPTTTPPSYSTLSPTQSFLITVTPTETSTPTRTPWPTHTPSPTPSQSPTPTATLSGTATPTATFVPTITLTPYTLQGYQTEYKNVLKIYRTLGMNETDFRRIYYRDTLLRQKVYDVITKDVLPEQEQVWARHILVADEGTARLVLALLKYGGDWNSLATRYSTDTGTKDNGGDLGWFGRGMMVVVFEEAAFSLKIGEVSQPVQSDYGWHLVQVLGHEVRPLTNSEYQSSRDDVFQNWLDAQRNNSDVVIYDVWQEFVPAYPKLEEEMLKLIYAQQTAIAEMQGQP